MAKKLSKKLQTPLKEFIRTTGYLDGVEAFALLI
jgi:hypothetical protein